MALAKFTQQPSDKLDYDISFAAWLDDRADTIQSISVIVDDGLTVGSGTNGADAPTSFAGVVKFWVFGGTDGVSYKVTVTVTTVGGRIKQAEVILKVKET